MKLGLTMGMGLDLAMSVRLGWGWDGVADVAGDEVSYVLTPSACSIWSSEDTPRSQAGGNAGRIHYHQVPTS